MRKKQINPFAFTVIIWALCIIGITWYAIRNPKIEYVEVLSEPEIVTVERIVEVEVEVIKEDEATKPYYAEIAESITEYEKELLAKLVYEEARGESLLGMRGVVEVVLNRTRDSRFPDTIHEVIYQGNPTQFTPARKLKSTTPTDKERLAVDMVLRSSIPVLEDHVLFFSTSRNGYKEYVKIGAHYFCYKG